MSWQEVQNVRDNSQAKGYELLALMMIATRVNELENKGSAWPSIETLAKDCNCTPRFAQKIVAGWRENPHEVYVSDGGGRKKCNLYIVLVGCSYDEILRRLMINLQINPTEAATLAAQCGYEKGVAMDTVSNEKGEQYDMKRVNIGHQKGERWTQTTSQWTPEKELEKELLEKETSEKESFYSSDTPPIPTEEKKSILQFPSSEDDEWILELAQIMGCPLEGPPRLVRDTRVTLRGYLRDLRAVDATVTLADLRQYPKFYALKKAPDMPFPTLRFLLQGWKTYKAWLAEQPPDAETIVTGDFLPGTGLFVYALPVYWQQVARGVEAGWVMDCITEDGARCQFIKQPDGTFSRAAQAS